MKNNKFQFKIISIFIGLVIGLLVAEIGMRLYQYYTFQNLDYLKVGDRMPIQKPNEELTLGQIIQLSSNPKIVYELIPSSSYHFKNVVVETNARGFRGRDFSNTHTHSKRIVGIGDSGMFGWGVREEESYLRQLETRLNQNDSIEYEILNTSVPGYNTVMEVEVLASKIDMSKVDLVLIDFIANDFELPGFIRKRPDFLTLEKSFILLHIEEYWLGKAQQRDNRLGNAPMNDRNVFEDDPEKVPEEYRDLVGRDAYAKAMQRLKELSVTYGFKVLVISQSPYLEVPEIVTSTCEKWDLEFLDFAPYWKKYKNENPNARWKLSDHDWHPTEEGHREIASVLYEKVNQLISESVD